MMIDHFSRANERRTVQCGVSIRARRVAYRCSSISALRSARRTTDMAPFAVSGSDAAIAVNSASVQSFRPSRAWARFLGFGTVASYTFIFKTPNVGNERLP